MRLWTIYFRVAQDLEKQPLGFGIDFEYGAPDFRTYPPLSVTLVPGSFKESKTEDSIQSDGFTWRHKPILDNGPYERSLRNEMATPDATCRLDIAPFPVVEVRIREMPFGSEPLEVFYLVDITVS